MVTEKPIRSIAYARTSLILKQDPQLQLVAIRDYASRNAIELVAEYVDPMSGTKARRPGIDALIADVKAEKCDVVLVAALDRLGRNTKDMLALADQFVESRVGLISLRENVNLDTPSGRAFFGIVSIISELDRSAIAERIRVALASKRMIAEQTNNGWFCGRPRKVVPALMADVHRLRAEGLSIRKIAVQLGIAKASVQRALAVPKPSSEKRREDSDDD